MRLPTTPPTAPPDSAKDEDPPRVRLRRFLQTSTERHAIVLLGGALNISDAVAEFAAVAALQGRVPLVVGPPALSHEAFVMLSEANMRRPTEFVARLDRIMAHHSTWRPSPLVAFVPSPRCIEPWADVEALLDTRGSEALPRLCLPDPEAVPSLGGAATNLLARRHSAALWL